METANRRREAAVHRRGQKTAGDAHEGTSRLQVPAQEEAQNAAEGGVPVLHTLPVGTHGCPSGRSVQTVEKYLIINNNNISTVNG
jgi:hypothetical protein